MDDDWDKHMVFTDADLQKPQQPRKRGRKPKPPHPHKSGLTDLEMADVAQVSFINLCHFFAPELSALIEAGDRRCGTTTTLTSHEISTLKNNGIIRRRPLRAIQEPVFEVLPIARYIVSTAKPLPPELEDVEEDDDE